MPDSSRGRGGQIIWVINGNYVGFDAIRRCPLVDANVVDEVEEKEKNLRAGRRRECEGTELTKLGRRSLGGRARC